MRENPWQEVHGTPIPPEQAWRTFEEWRSEGKEIGIFFAHRAGMISTLANIHSARNGILQLDSDGAKATFRLNDAKFTYGPVPMYPRWPSPPVVEVQAIQAYLVTGDWLVLAEGLVPGSLSGPLALPA